jgi:hypothetical protein
MSTPANQPSPSAQKRTVIILGGKGGLESKYREAVETYGYELRHYETRVPAKRAPSQHVAMVIVMVSMISHPLMAHAREIAGKHAEIVYLKSPSVSAVRQTVSRTHPGDGPGV